MIPHTRTLTARLYLETRTTCTEESVEMILYTAAYSGIGRDDTVAREMVVMIILPSSASSSSINIIAPLVSQLSKTLIADTLPRVLMAA
jgi:hypothetical protein